MTLSGRGFTDDTYVTICDTICEPVGAIQASSMSVVIPATAKGADATIDCDVTVTQDTATSTISSAYQYTDQKTATVSDVTPLRGSTGGGTSITITGTGFT